MGANLFPLYPAGQVPWFWTRIFLLEKRFDNIRQLAALDPEKLAPPKDIWLDDDEIERWLESRKKLRDA